MSLYQGITAENITELTKFRQAQHTLAIELMNKMKQWNIDMAPILEQYHLTVMEEQKPYQIVNDIIVRKTVEVCLDISGDKYNNAMTAEQDQELVEVLDEHQLMIKAVQVNKPTMDGYYFASTLITTIDHTEWVYKTPKALLFKTSFSDVSISYEIYKINGVLAYLILTIPSNMQKEDLKAYINSGATKITINYISYAVNKSIIIKMISKTLSSNISLMYCEELCFNYHFFDINMLRNAEHNWNYVKIINKYNYGEIKELIPFITQTSLTTITGLNAELFPGLKELLPHMNIS